MSESRIDVVRVEVGRDTITLAWTTTEALLERCQDPSMDELRQAFANAGTSAPVVLTREWMIHLLDVIERWSDENPPLGVMTLPEGIFELMKSLRDHTASPEDGVVLRADLIDVARDLLDDTGRLRAGPAVVIAQSAVEVTFEGSIDMILFARSTHDPLRRWVTRKTARTWSPTNKSLQALWLALTDDTITEAPGWKDYADGIDLRHDVVHRAIPVSRDEAERFIDAADQLIGHIHLTTVMVAMPLLTEE